MHLSIRLRGSNLLLVVCWVDGWGVGADIVLLVLVCFALLVLVCVVCVVLLFV